MVLDRQGDRLSHGLTLALGSRRENFARLAATLDALSPLKVLGRGYSIAKGPRGILKSVKDAKPGEALKLTLTDGELDCTVD